MGVLIGWMKTKVFRQLFLLGGRVTSVWNTECTGTLKSPLFYQSDRWIRIIQQLLGLLTQEYTVLCCDKFCNTNVLITLSLTRSHTHLFPLFFAFFAFTSSLLFLPPPCPLCQDDSSVSSGDLDMSDPPTWISVDHVPVSELSPPSQGERMHSPHSAPQGGDGKMQSGDLYPV